MIHESVIIDPSAKIADDVEIGAYSIIDKNVCISEGTVIKENAVIRENTTIGKNNLIYQRLLKLLLMPVLSRPIAFEHMLYFQGFVREVEVI